VILSYNQSMAIKIWLKKILTGYVILEETESPVNGRIQVIEDIFGKRRLVVGGLTQSGEAVEEIWRLIIKQLSNRAIRRCLILGLGAGSAAGVVSRFFPGIKIIGIEIDSEIIRLGKKYFGLNKIKNLKIINGDAISWLKTCFNDLNHRNRNFDLVLVDIYLGSRVPGKAEKDAFLEGVKRIIGKRGRAVFNRLYYANKRKETDDFEKKLKKYFSEIEIIKASANKLFVCGNINAK